MRDKIIRNGSLSRRRSDSRYNAKKQSLNSSIKPSISNAIYNSKVDLTQMRKLNVPNNSNMTVLIMALNNTQQLFDVLGTITPVVNELSHNMATGNLGPGEEQDKIYFKSPLCGGVKDSRALNTQRIQMRKEDSSKIDNITKNN